MHSIFLAKKICFSFYERLTCLEAQSETVDIHVNVLAFYIPPPLPPPALVFDQAYTHTGQYK